MTEFHTLKPIDNSRLVRPMAPHRLRETARLLALGGLVTAVALLYAWQHFACIQLRYQLESLKSQRAQAAELNQELRLETAPAAGQVAPFETSSEAVLAEMRRTSSTRAQ